MAIQAAVPAEYWKHCPGSSNPADLLSRGTTTTELTNNPQWVNWPDWLKECQEQQSNCEADMAVSDECLVETKQTSTAGSHALIAAQSTTARVGQVIDCTRFSSLMRLCK